MIGIVAMGFRICATMSTRICATMSTLVSSAEVVAMKLYKITLLIRVPSHQLILQLFPLIKSQITLRFANLNAQEHDD